jgi:DNA excision repair protein ERCC-6
MSTNEEASRLRDLQADVRDQDDLERDITRQV